MKKVFLIIIFFLFGSVVNASEVVSANFVRCDDNYTFVFSNNDIEEKYTFLGIDYEDSDYACSMLSSAKSILLEVPKEDYVDALGRKAAWIWIDEILLQEHLVEDASAKVNMEQGKYTLDLCFIQDDVIARKIGIWEKASDKGICAAIDYSTADGIIDFDSPEIIISDKTIETLDKIDQKLTDFTDNKDIQKYYVIIFIAFAFVVFLYKEFKS